MAVRQEILLIEDHYLTQDLIRLFLEKNGFHVICAASGEDALIALSTQEFPVILLDLGLPDYEGLELIEKIIKTQAAKPPVFIAITGQIDDTMKAQALDAGCVAVLEKPIMELHKVNGRSIVTYLHEQLQYNN
ncbi:MAG: two-component response regulator [Gammaproteobacteria bacterium]|jgi:two-component system KDP operon response regulator KdpE|nr:two-component response regulator [Gammaproteobacteria bacterium]